MFGTPSVPPRWSSLDVIRCSLAALLLSLCIRSGAGAAEQSIQFNRDVLPILAENCFACHGFDADAREADLRLDQRASATAARDGSPAIVPGRAEASALISRVCATEPDERMPPPESGKQLSSDQQRILQQWIAQGAPYEAHWSFEPPSPIDPPEVAGVDHPIDRFIQARLSSTGLTPASRAAPSTLLRRLSLDLIGLPPSPAEIDAFEQAYHDDSAAACSGAVDRLLASPHYGERWGRWWLDQARYADSNGYSIDAPRSIWKYRDWVVAAFNDDMPFDQFTVEQIAGDMLPGATVSQRIATGFHRNTQINQEGGIDKEQFRVDSVFDRVATTGSVWLGLTIGCAQCHDHKFDPISQVEYYRLFAFFNNQEEPTLKVFASGVDEEQLTAERDFAAKRLKALLRGRRKELSAWEASLTEASRAELPDAVQQALGVAKKERTLADKITLFAAGCADSVDPFFLLLKVYNELSAELRDAPTTMVLRELQQPRKTSVFIKGDFTRPREQVTPGTPEVLHPLMAGTNPTRLDLARWLVSDDNPLTARVIVNRIWQQYFGTGLVDTENDLGMVGARPSHPGLLDWLARDLMASGWNLKSLHRRITSSHAYRQASTQTALHQQIDPDNRLLSRQTRIRLDAEIIRDAALAASDLLVPKMGGPPVYPPIPQGVMNQGQVARDWQESTGDDRYRRGLYTFFFRATPPPALAVFDAPDGYSACTRRTRSNTPLQSLTLMNDAAFFEFAQALSEIIAEEGLTEAFRRCTSRRPRPEELDVLEKLDHLTAARTLLNLDETITRE